MNRQEIYIPYNVTPVEFWGYTSWVAQRFLEVRYQTGDAISDFRDYLITKFQDAGFDAQLDNKIVFECALEGRKVYIGFYDNSMSIGFDMGTDYYNIQAKRHSRQVKQSHCVNRTCTNNRWER